MCEELDILKNFRYTHKYVYENLLYDHTTRKNIVWATNRMTEKIYSFEEINFDILALEFNDIRNRFTKKVFDQKQRAKDNAEVYTPVWICNAQNNLIDEAWFGRPNVFNVENDDHTWTTNTKKIVFSENDEKSWKKYVRSVRMEMTCGEAPYMVSRYDMTTGKRIPLNERVGFVDRKLRIVNENASSDEEWNLMVQDAFKSSYGYELQGDSLLLARENLLFTYVENYYNRYKKYPAKQTLKYIAYIISWNVWQMDGLRFTVPTNNTTNEEKIYCKIRDWKKKKKTIIEYRNLLNS